MDLWAEWEANRDWVGPEQSVDGLLLSNQFEVLDGPGTVSHDRAVEVSDERYEQFADRRRKEEARLADESDLLIEGLNEGINLTAKPGEIGMFCGRAGVWHGTCYMVSRDE